MPFKIWIGSQSQGIKEKENQPANLYFENDFLWIMTDFKIQRLIQNFNKFLLPKYSPI